MKLFRSKHVDSLAELVKACQRQEHRAQVQFYERYKGRLMSICLRYTRTVAEAEDIFQEGILKIFDRIPRQLFQIWQDGVSARRHKNGVTVWGRLCDYVSTQYAAASHPIFDNYWLLQLSPHLLAYETRHEINATTRCKRNDEMNRARWVFVRSTLLR